MSHLKKTSLKIVNVPINDLKPVSYNPRACTPEEEKHIEQSLLEYGQVDPLIANNARNRMNFLIGGHQRWRIMKKLGYKFVSVVYVTISSPKKEKQLNLRLNRNTGHWDWDKLRELFDIELLEDVGFDDSDFSRIFDDTLETEDDYFDVEKELENIKKPKSKIGELYRLGDHRLIVGDSTDIAVVKRLMGKYRVSFIDTDPPFSIRLDYNKGVSGKQNYGGKTNDNMSEKDYRGFLSALMSNALSVAQPDAHIFFWCDENWVWLLQTLYKELGIKQQRLCWWLKGNWSMTPQIAFNKAAECCVYGTRGSPYLAEAVTNLHEVMNKEVGVGNRMIEDVIDMFSVWLCKRIHSLEYEHPTQKNPTLHEKALRRCSKPGDRILDLTAGSGSLMVACEQLHRKAYLAEIEPIFADLIIRRFEALTGKKASLISS